MFLPQFLKGLAIGSGIVLLLVIAAFRQWRLSMYALLPTVIGLLWAAGVLALFRVELDLFAVFAVVTFVGVGVDYGIHLVHRFQERSDAVQATAELAPVILAAAAITFFGYGTLFTSSYPAVAVDRHRLRGECHHAGGCIGAGPARAAHGAAVVKTAALIPAYNEVAHDRGRCRWGRSLRRSRNRRRRWIE